MFKHIESVILFVPDIGAAARWYADLLGTGVEHENPLYAFVRAPGLLIDPFGCTIGLNQAPKT
ncbi:MAG: hypothetical protein Q8R98_21295 [Rubrivivax sp.]|nr:hypothetical protein [Rubrivivax sp.]MDP3614386.1 hypothetical protein [Rubrivivax sp.]